MTNIQEHFDRICAENAPRREAFASAVRKLMRESGLGNADQSSLLQSLAYQAARTALGGSMGAVGVGCADA